MAVLQSFSRLVLILSCHNVYTTSEKQAKYMYIHMLGKEQGNQAYKFSRFPSYFPG
jgi:hypothetical protein